MTFECRRMTVRVAAAMVAPGLLAAGTVAAAGPAAADDGEPRRGGAVATLGGLRTSDEAVVLRNGEERRTGAGLFEMAVDDGGSLQTYSVDIDNPTQNQAGYEEVPWSASSLHDNSNAGKIRWILQHSYPQVNDLDALAAKAGAKRLTAETAAAGTQVAIWRYSDDVEVSAADPDAEKLADHLGKAARTLGEPAASLTLDRSAISGRSDGLLGPVTVRTGAASVAVTAAPGVHGQAAEVVDRNGRDVAEASNGSRLYLRAPSRVEAGTGSLTVQASTKVPVGRALTGTGRHMQSQAHVVAGSSQSTVSATAAANWAETGPLPAVTAVENCEKGGIDVTVVNSGDAAYRFALDGQKRSVGPGASRTLTVPAEENRPYRIPAPGPGGGERTLTGVLDCATASETAATDRRRDAQGLTPQGAPASSGGSAGRAGDGTPENGTDLAETGSSNTGLIIGIAVALVIVGAVALLVVRRGTSSQTGTDGEAESAGADGGTSPGR